MLHFHLYSTDVHCQKEIPCALVSSLDSTEGKGIYSHFFTLCSLQDSHYSRVTNIDTHVVAHLSLLTITHPLETGRSLFSSLFDGADFPYIIPSSLRGSPHLPILKDPNGGMAVGEHGL